MKKQVIMDYHERTKHHLDAYAKGPTHIDWEKQPDLFRRYAGSKRFPLPLVADNLSVSFNQIYATNAVPAKALNIESIGAFLELSLGISAWKQYAGKRWPLRCNPSSGNLHPTEAYLILPQLDDTPSGVYHYLSVDHVLEQRGRFDSNLHQKDNFLIGLSSILWREAWKYGERSFRYCQHDIGHAIASIEYAAATLGWRAQLKDDWSEAVMKEALGLDRNQLAEREVAEAMICIHTQPLEPASCEILHEIPMTDWLGKPNILDPNHHYAWPIVESVCTATVKPVVVRVAKQQMQWQPTDLPILRESTCQQKAADIIRQRRSAQYFDGLTELNLDSFYRILDSTLPRKECIPWDVFPYQPKLQLILFIHRVEGLEPGAYVLSRDENSLDKLKNTFDQRFEWLKPENCPEHMHLYRLLTGDTQELAQQISCHQEIAADGAFSLAMLAEFEESLDRGAWVYRRLFWEAGIIGQVLYLEAEAAGVRGTGIGCYFDDLVHDFLGLKDNSFQSLYHFTIGTPIEDKRIESLPPYADLKR